MSAQMWLENLASYSVQVAVLVPAGALLLWSFRLKTPRVLLAFWQLLLAGCLVLPLLQPWRELQAPQAAARAVETVVGRLPALALPEAAAVISAQPRPWSWPFPVYETIGIVLAAGVILRFLWLALGLLRLRHFRNESRRLSALPEPVQEMLWRVGVKPEIFLSPHIDTPVTFGWQKPAVLFPESFTEMAAALQKPIACHELLHVERRDWLYIILEEIVRSLLWFHPAIWWALARIALSREQVVDREVLRVTGERGPYLESLLHIASLRGRPAAVPAPLLLKERHLVQRVALMLKESKMTRSRLILSLAAIAVFLLATGAFAAAWFPITAPRAQEAPAAVSQPAPPIPAPAIKKAPPLPTPAVKIPAPAARERAAIAPAKPIGPLPVPAAPVAQVSQEPIRVGGNVQESKLIKKVEPIYPELAKRARVEQIVMLETTINEEGLVSNVRVIKGHPLLDQAAVEAVKQWVYQPTYLNGRPMPVIATVTLPFSLSPQVTLAADGYLKDAQGGIVPLESLRDGPVRITPAAGASFELIQRTLSNLNAQGIARITLVSQGYSWIGGRLFYQSPSVTNFDPTTKAPVIEYDTARAVELAKASGRLPVGSSGVIGLAYTVCIDESAKIVAVVGQSGPWSIPEVDEVFRQARVISPGLKDNTPVPMALRITLQVPLN